MEEHFFQCIHCWEEISMLLDNSINNQVYIEDCEVCCQSNKCILTDKEIISNLLEEFRVFKKETNKIFLALCR
ncbi:MAG TPA: hypothetical protein DDZ39_11905, partial [Flavobacteriaceae bacterium]|nr:hypothetical protein [Flavobacteriaceae bacterium]